MGVVAVTHSQRKARMNVVSCAMVGFCDYRYFILAWRILEAETTVVALNWEINYQTSSSGRTSKKLAVATIKKWSFPSI